MSKLTTPRDLLVQEIKDLYSAETQLIKALPRMAKAASHPDLKTAFSQHLEETRRHAGRIEEIMTKLDETPRGKKCKAMEGLLEEGKEVIEEDAASAIKDLALIAAAQKIEHYEIAGYGCARTLADLIGESELADALQETLDEEGTTDKLLTEIAMGINIEVGVTVDG
jgi:ferritin-like metal-binding protein YciE